MKVPLSREPWRSMRILLIENGPVVAQSITLMLRAESDHVGSYPAAAK